VLLLGWLGLVLAVAACSGDVSARRARFVERGDAYVKEGKLREAAIEYRNAVELQANDGATRARLAETYARIGDTSRALPEYVAAADLLPTDSRIQLEAGRYLLGGGRAKEALARADGVLARDPQDIDANILRGNALAGLRDLEGALNAIEEAIRIDPARGSTYTQLGYIELARGRQAESEAAFKKAVDAAPQQIDGHLALANFYWGLNRIPEAERAFEAALKVDPQHRVANRAMALFMLTTRRILQAEPYLQQLAAIEDDTASQFGLVDYYLATNRIKDAVARLEPLAQKNATAKPAKRRLARASAISGDPQKAHAILDDLLKQDAQDAETQLQKGQMLLTEGKRDEALKHVLAAVKSRPNSAIAQYSLGKIYAARGDITAAETAYREVLRLNPRAAAAQVELSQLLLAAGKSEASLQTAEEAARNQPTSVAARLALVRSLLARRDGERASRELQVLLTQRPNDAAVHVQNGVLASLQKNPTGARAAFTRALTIEPNSTEALAGLVALDLTATNLDAAKKRVDDALAKRRSPEILLLAARTYAATKDQATAERLLRNAIELEPTLLPAYGMLGQLYLQQNKLEEARKEFDALAARQAKPVAALTMSGMILQSQGNNGLARERFEKALSFDPSAAVAGNNLAWIVMDTGDLNTALQLAQSAASAAPDVPEIMDTLGWVYYRKELTALAIPLFTRALDKSPDNPTYHYHLGMAYAQGKDTDRARSSLQRALALRSDFAGADEARRTLSGLPAK
jgi:tetratricopeptide (TPR) repeat protein